MTRTAILPNTKLLIGGDWADAENGQRFVMLNPANEETIAEIARGGVADVDPAVRAARQALSGPWGAMTAPPKAGVRRVEQDVGRAHCFAHGINAGMTWVNTYGRPIRACPGVAWAASPVSGVTSAAPPSMPYRRQDRVAAARLRVAAQTLTGR